MAQLTASSWQGSGDKKGKERRSKKERPAKKVSAPKQVPSKKESPVKKASTPKQAPSKKESPVKKEKQIAQPPRTPKLKGTSSRDNSFTRNAYRIGGSVLVAALVAGGGYFSYSKGLFDNASPQDTTSTNAATIAAPVPVENNLTASEVAGAVDLAYAPAITTEGTAVLPDNREISFETTWISDGSLGQGVVKLGSATGDVMIYKNTILIDNSSGLADAFISQPSDISGWVIMVNPSFEQAFPSHSYISAVTAVPETDLVTTPTSAKGGGIEVTINQGVATQFTTPTNRYTISAAEPSDVQPLPEGFKADGKLELVEGKWESALFAHD